MNICKCGCDLKCYYEYRTGHSPLNVCECGCDAKVKNRFVRGHSQRGRHFSWNKNKHHEYAEKQKVYGLNICACGCKQKCNKNFVHGHHIRGTHINSGRSAWNKGLSPSDETIVKISAALMGHPVSAETIAKIMKNSGKRRFAYISGNGIIIKMRSSWETKYAAFLDSLNIVWQYEPRGFLLSSGHRYFPDFYLPEINEWHEVKGWMSPESICKISLFQKEYPNEKLLIISKLPVEA